MQKELSCEVAAPFLTGPACSAGLIYPIDTFRGFRKIGFNPFLSFFAIFVIHGTFSYPSQPTWVPDPLLSLNTANMHRTKHGSDTETYDTEGRYNPVSVPTCNRLLSMLCVPASVILPSAATQKGTHFGTVQLPVSFRMVMLQSGKVAAKGYRV